MLWRMAATIPRNATSGCALALRTFERRDSLDATSLRPALLKRSLADVTLTLCPTWASKHSKTSASTSTVRAYQRMVGRLTPAVREALGHIQGVRPYAKVGHDVLKTMGYGRSGGGHSGGSKLENRLMFTI